MPAFAELPQERWNGTVALAEGVWFSSGFVPDCVKKLVCSVGFGLIKRTPPVPGRQSEPFLLPHQQ